MNYWHQSDILFLILLTKNMFHENLNQSHQQKEGIKNSNQEIIRYSPDYDSHIDGFWFLPNWDTNSIKDIDEVTFSRHIFFA